MLDVYLGGRGYLHAIGSLLCRLRVYIRYKVDGHDLHSSGIRLNISIACEAFGSCEVHMRNCLLGVRYCSGINLSGVD